MQLISWNLKYPARRGVTNFDSSARLNSYKVLAEDFSIYLTYSTKKFPPNDYDVNFFALVSAHLILRFDFYRNTKRSNIWRWLYSLNSDKSSNLLGGFKIIRSDKLVSDTNCRGWQNFIFVVFLFYFEFTSEIRLGPLSLKCSYFKFCPSLNKNFWWIAKSEQYFRWCCI